MDTNDYTTEKVSMLTERIDEECRRLQKVVERITRYSNSVEEFLKNSASRNLTATGQYPDKSQRSNIGDITN